MDEKTNSHKGGGKLIQDEIAENQRNNNMLVIPPKKLQEVQQECPKLRVAAYCRVSTQEEEQVGGFDMQVPHFTQRIESNPDQRLPGYVHQPERRHFHQESA